MARAARHDDAVELVLAHLCALNAQSLVRQRLGRLRRARSTRENVHIGFPYFGRPATVSMNEIDLWLERLYWIAMISVPFLAIWAGRIALRQVQTASQQVDAALQEAQTTKLLKILQHVEEQRVVDARHLVMTEIRRQEEEGKNWWENDERLQRAADQLCASYDHLGGIIKFDGPDRVGQYFLERWGRRHYSGSRCIGALFSVQEEIRAQ